MYWALLTFRCLAKANNHKLYEFHAWTSRCVCAEMWDVCTDIDRLVHLIAHLCMKTQTPGMRMQMYTLLYSFESLFDHLYKAWVYNFEKWLKSDHLVLIWGQLTQSCFYFWLLGWVRLGSIRPLGFYLGSMLDHFIFISVKYGRHITFRLYMWFFDHTRCVLQSKHPTKAFCTLKMHSTCFFYEKGMKQKRALARNAPAWST